MNIFGFIDRIPLKIKVYLPIFGAIVFSVFFITLQSVRSGKDALHESFKQGLTLEVQSITKMFEREKDLKLQSVKTLLKIAQNHFEASEFEISKLYDTAVIENRITGNKYTADLQKWYLNGKDISQDYSFVDYIKNEYTVTATIFQKTDSGYVRISTNVPTKHGERAIHTYIPAQSEVVQTIESGKEFYGRAFVVNAQYITAYRPIEYDGKVRGMLYVGIAEKNIEKLGKLLDELELRKSGEIFVLNRAGEFVYPADKEGSSWNEKEVFERMNQKQAGLIEYAETESKEVNILAYNYFSDFELYIVSQINKHTEDSNITRRMVKNSIIISAIILGLLTAFIIFITNEGINRYLQRIKKSEKKLESTEEALRYSENKFRTLFNYSSDEIFVADLNGRILEVNQVACESLGYTREELLKMNFTDLKNDKYRPKVKENIEIIKQQKKYTYETEHIAKDGSSIATEMKSRLISFNGNPAILSISRNITERKRIQKQIIQTIIQTEEKERKRFAADLHDGLSPILSTIRLYSDLLRTKQQSRGKETELIDNIEELADMAIMSAKEIANNLTPQILYDFGLATAIHEFCNFLNKTKSVKISVDTKGYKLTNRTFEESVLFQTTKELINNTVKHAKAKNITIELKNTEKYIYLYYRDDGVGFDVSGMMKSSSGLGLSNIQNKIKTIKGTCDFNSRKDEGMFVMISVNTEQQKSSGASPH